MITGGKKRKTARNRKSMGTAWKAVARKKAVRSVKRNWGGTGERLRNHAAGRRIYKAAQRIAVITARGMGKAVSVTVRIAAKGTGKTVRITARIAVRGTIGAAKGTAKLAIKGTKGAVKAGIRAGKDFVKAGIGAQEGGGEILSSIESGKTVARSTKSLVKTGVELGKTMYRSGKQTRHILAGVRGKNEYSGKGCSYNSGKQEQKQDVDGRKRKGRDGYRERHKKKQEGVAKKRIRQYMQNKFSSNPERKDSIGAVVKDVLKQKIANVGKRVAAWAARKALFLVMGAVASIIAAILPAVLVVVLLMSPFAIFFPQEDGGTETLSSVLDGYYADFVSRIDKEMNEEGYDKIKLKSYTGQTDVDVSHGNYVDVLCIFAEKYGYDLELSKVEEKVKERLKEVFDDMNYYAVSEKKTAKTNKKGETKEKKIKIIVLTQKSWQDMAETYQFTEDQKKETKELCELAGDAGMGAAGDDGVYDASPVYTGDSGIADEEMK